MQIKLGKHQLSYEISGEGIPLLLMHAFPMTQAMFEAQRKALGEGVQLITFDVPGVGESEPAPVTIQGIADLADQLLESLEIPQAVVGGVSMGGYAAFAFARRHSERLSGLLLANTKPSADSEEAKKGRRDLAKVALDHGPAEVAERLLPKLLGKSSHQSRPELVGRVREMAGSVSGETIARLLEALEKRPDSTDLLSKIKVPTLVIAGEEDSIAPPAETNDWAYQISKARYVSLPEAGHLPNMEAPDAFNQAVKDFFDRLPL